MVLRLSLSTMMRHSRHAAAFRRPYACFYSTQKTISPTFPTLARSNKASSSSSSPLSLPDVRVDHLVVGGGAVGLSVAFALAQRFPDKTTYLVERHSRFGEETSSRNSEVIHAGLFYPPSSLKTNLCLRGRELLYAFCQQNSVPYKQTGKLTVGTQSSKAYLEGIVQHVHSLSETKDNLGALIAGDRLAPPLRIIQGEEARALEPDLGANVGWTLESTRTGIVDSHEFMAALERMTLDSECAEIVYETSVVGIKPVGAHSFQITNTKRGGVGDALHGWIVETQTEDGEVDSLLARHVINTSGLNAPAMLNSLLRDGHFGSSGLESSKIGMWYSKGNYASYSKAKGGVGRVQRLLYPLPDLGSSSDKFGHQGLGTHLTLDLNGNVRFGPDTDWLVPPNEPCADWWNAGLVALQPSSYTENQRTEEERLDDIYASVASFLPGIKREGISADYAGIRPKLVGPGGGFVDFTIYYHAVHHLDRQSVRQLAFDGDRWDDGSSKSKRDALFTGAFSVPQPSLISLCGIESPGLTSSLALAEVVANLIAKRGWGEKLDDHRSPNPPPKGAQNEDAGHLDQWA